MLKPSHKTAQNANLQCRERADAVSALLVHPECFCEGLPFDSALVATPRYIPNSLMAMTEPARPSPRKSHSQSQAAREATPVHPILSANIANRRNPREFPAEPDECAAAAIPGNCFERRLPYRTSLHSPSIGSCRQSQRLARDSSRVQD